MNIGQAATRARLPAKTIRYYDEIGLIEPARGDNGYRDFSEDDLHRLKFISRSRSLGFSVEDCRALLALYADPGRASVDVKHLASEHLAHIERKIADLKAMHATLSELVEACAGDQRPDCPILRGLARG